MYEEIKVASAEACTVIKRLDLHETIVETNFLIACNLTNFVPIEEIASQVEKLKSVANEACTIAQRPDLYDKIVQANYNLMQATVSINNVRAEYPAFDQWLQSWSEQAFGFQQGKGTMH